ncbi:hypothetical protein OG264_36175 [Streptomyces xanthophaeus]|uniref:hypothetical protein n=1 Tax=Streptomyces xanthophaeus TaxID=67385 RepID=UPI00386D8604|nr:hypothetical protein OG264_36175 [Streptomyces xanthophaeus]WST58546.1 hypothetical protein OG605_02260 [Streptomyces xanthophaeus]
MVCQYRNPPHGLWDLLAVAATDRDPDIRWIAYDLVPEAGRHVAAHAELVGALEPARAGHPAFPTREAVRALGAIGAPAAQAGPVLRQLLDEPERTTGVYAVCRNILEDEALCRALSEALERIDG